MEIYGLHEVDKAVAEIQGRAERELLARPNVVGVGVGRKTVAGQDTGEPCLIVFVSRKQPEQLLSAAQRIPKSVEHCSTDVLEVGRVLAGASTPSVSCEAGLARQSHQSEGTTRGPELLRRRVRPARGGYSVGHLDALAGTIAGGAIDVDAYPGLPSRYYLLSVNHVLANLNQAKLGDPILQPGASDGGREPDDAIARLARFVPLHFDDRVNQVDAAIAEVDFEDLDRSVFYIGYPRERAARVRIGQVLQKTGRTTHYTSGLVRAVNVTLKVNYGERSALFCQQIVTSRLSLMGDSGSLVLDAERHAVGLLFATSPNISVLNPIGLVETSLGIRVGF